MYCDLHCTYEGAKETDEEQNHVDMAQRKHKIRCQRSAVSHRRYSQSESKREKGEGSEGNYHNSDKSRI